MNDKEKPWVVFDGDRPEHRHPISFEAHTHPISEDDLKGDKPEPLGNSPWIKED